MANWLYNGVELPEIPSSAEEYPYRYIVYFNSEYYMEAGTTLPYGVSNGVHMPGGMRRYKCSQGATQWSLYSSIPGTTVNWGTTVTELQKNIIWANFDLYYEPTGELAIAASEPVDPNAPTEAETPTFTENLPLWGEYTYTQGDTADTLSVTAEVSDGGTITYQWYMDDVEIPGATGSSYTPEADKIGTRTYFCRATNTLASGLTATTDSNSVTVKTLLAFNPASYILGRQFGKRIIAQRNPRMPVAYLYNGVRLPKLPEWDREMYPFAIVGKTFNVYRFWACAVQAAPGPLGDGSSVAFQYTIDGECQRWSLVDEVWTDDGIRDDDALASTAAVWANYDLQKTDGTVYIAASEPTPIYH